jgi:excisionase family DNA binding protein
MDISILTVEDVSAFLNLKETTIRKFIRDGKLKAQKIGKQWRISKEHLDTFVGRDAIKTPPPERETEIDDADDRHIHVSTVIDLTGVDRAEADRLSASIVAVLNGKDASYGNVRFDYVFYGEERKARFLLWGDPKFIGELLILQAKMAGT